MCLRYVISSNRWLLHCAARTASTSLTHTRSHTKVLTSHSVVLCRRCRMGKYRLHEVEASARCAGIVIIMTHSFRYSGQFVSRASMHHRDESIKTRNRRREKKVQAPIYSFLSVLLLFNPDMCVLLFVRLSLTSAWIGCHMKCGIFFREQKKTKFSANSNRMNCEFRCISVDRHTYDVRSGCRLWFERNLSLTCCV